MKNIKSSLTIEKIITEGIELKKIAIETNDDELLDQMNDIEEFVDEIIEECDRLNI
jgi:hypothetical protein